MTDLKGVASGLGVDEKLLQQLSAASSLEANPTHAVTLAGDRECFHTLVPMCTHMCMYVCMCAHAYELYSIT